jgi:hypothetical protein
MCAMQRQRFKNLKSKWAIPPWLVLGSDVLQFICNRISDVLQARELWHQRTSWLTGVHLNMNGAAQVTLLILAMAWLLVIAFWPEIRKGSASAQATQHPAMPEMRPMVVPAGYGTSPDGHHGLFCVV